MKILVIDKNEALSDEVAGQLTSNGHELETDSHPESIAQRLKRSDVDLAIVAADQLNPPVKRIVQWIKAAAPNLPVLVAPVN